MNSHVHQAAAGNSPALLLDGVDISYTVRGQTQQVIRDLSFRINPGEAFGLVGESGCGKSTVALATVNYLPRNGSVSRGRIVVAGSNLVGLRGDELRRTRSNTVAMVYQDPGRALNPSIRIGRQLAEVFILKHLSPSEAMAKAEDSLRQVHIVDPERVMQLYPHELSGGMQQRVSIAMALAANPKLLVLDEPTTALDATVEAEVLDLIAELRRTYGTSVLFISHNVAVVSHICDRVGVLYAGKLVEIGTTAEVFGSPKHPYTVSLLRCLPQLGRTKSHGRLETIPGYLPSGGADIPGCVFSERCALADERCRTTPPPLFDVDALSGHASRCFHYHRAAALPRATAADAIGTYVIDRERPPVLRVRNLSKHFGTSGNAVRALSGFDIDLWPGETLGLVGESGSGKTTFARLLTGIQRPDPGSCMSLGDALLPGRTRERTRAQLKALQLIFQNPDSALNQSHSVSRMIGRAITKLTGISGKLQKSRLRELASAVRLATRFLSMRPKQLSGGLKQRVAIARTFAGEPSVVICDEPTSALDVSVQASILNLLADLQTDRHVSYILISHDLGVVRYLSDRIAVLYLGRLMEVGPAERVFAGPHHPYTAALLSAVSFLGKNKQDRIVLTGEIPGVAGASQGCAFHTRCPRRLGAICDEQEPPMLDGGDQMHKIRCHIPYAELQSRN